MITRSWNIRETNGEKTQLSHLKMFLTGSERPWQRLREPRGRGDKQRVGQMDTIVKIGDSAVLGRALPKRPQMYTTGLPVSIEAALEIIRRTDSFFCNHGLQFHPWPRTVAAHVRKPLNRPESEDTAWRREWGCVSTDYVYNEWVYSCFAYGPHGWMHPNGNVGFIDTIGNWPTVSEIVEDWCKLANAFPFLEIDVTLRDLSDPTQPDHVAGLRIRGTRIHLVDPDVTVLHKDHPDAERGNPHGDTVISSLRGASATDGGWHSMINLKQIERWAAAQLEQSF